MNSGLESVWTVDWSTGMECMNSQWTGMECMNSGLEYWHGGVGTNSGMGYWNGTLDWVILFFWTSFWIYFWKPTFSQFTCSWLLWMIVIMTMVGYHSVFIIKSKYTFEKLINTVYCKFLRWKSFVVFWSIDCQPWTFPA